MMRLYTKIVLLAATILLVGCQTKKAVVQTGSATDSTIENITPPTWHTMLLQNVHLTTKVSNKSYDVHCTMWAVRDSLSILSVQPMSGVEMYRVEATPEEIIIIDKMNRNYLHATYAEFSTLAAAPVTYKNIEDIVSREDMESKQDDMSMRLSILGTSLNIRISYPTVQIDVPVNTTRYNTTNFQRVSIEDFKK